MSRYIYSLLFLTGLALGDLYLQNPRGSNNRRSEANTDANNQQRLFDSQNNAKGGYCWGPSMYYYTGSQLSIEWTNQHGCGSPKLVCQLILQYMCGSTNDPAETLIRDGTTTTTITAGTVSDTDPTTGEYLYGMHESAEYYSKCSQRSANLGLYIADQADPSQNNLPATGGYAATRTRSQPTGTKYGFECPEERDYYPYWQPSPWKDIAVLTDDPTRCAYYQAESQNVKDRYECLPEGKENTQALCTAAGKTWTLVPAWGIAAPDCIKATPSRDNHLGNGGVNDWANNYNWTIPTANKDACLNDDTCVCVFRIRYNITSVEIPWDADYNNNALPYLKDDPTINMAVADSDADPTGNPNVTLKLAIDTTQFARTFQDRSHVFGFKIRPSTIPNNARIYNLNVRGKRGNIVQTYPATEYDFTPNVLNIRVGDYIHFQWTGCDTNPAGNAGEGTAQTDRSNMVQINDLGMAKFLTEADFASGKATPLFDDAATRARMANIDQTGCLTQAQLIAANPGNTGAQDANVGNCFKLNAAEPYFNGGALRMNNTGNFYYMSTRNNNFSNRGQKGVINVDPLLPVWAVAVVISGAVATGGAALAGAGMFYAKSHPHSFLAEKLASFEK